MRTIRDVLRLRLDAGLSERHTARSLGVPRTTVQDYCARFRASGLTWPLAATLDDGALEQALFARDRVPVATSRPLPEWARIAQEKRRKGVTLMLLWQEYRQAEPTGYSYSQFAEHYRQWRTTIDPVMRQEHRAGERTFVDDAGVTVDITAPTTGDVRAAQMFVGVLGASNYTFAEATWTQQVPDWIASHVRMLEYFGGVTALIIPDNLRSGVTYASYLRPRDQCDVRGLRDPLWHRDSADPGGRTTRQRESGNRRTDRRAGTAGPAPPSPLLLARGPQ
ncbi:MAG: transposase [Gemmatimonas sp.]|nr:transposase [Gemmatimonas sp.]